MIKGSDIVGLPILDKREGSRIGEIKDLIYSKDKFRALAFVVNGRGLFKGVEIIRFKDIEAVGNDAVIIQNKARIEKAKSIPELEELLTDKNKMIGNEVLSEEGEHFGYIQDVIIEVKKGKILAFVLTDGLIQDIMDGRNVLPCLKDMKFGKDALIVNSKIKEDYKKNKKEFKKLLELE